MGVVNIRDFPEELHRAAKVRAAQEGVSMKDIIIRAVTEYLNKKETDRKKGSKK